MKEEQDVPKIGKTLHSDPVGWVEKYADYLYRFALTRLRDKEVARDLVQDTFLAALQQLSKFEGKSDERTWLTAILKNKVVDFFRKQGSKGLQQTAKAENEQQDFFDPDNGHWNAKHYPRAFGLDDDNPMLAKELGKILHSCLKKLPELWFAVFSMKHIDDLKSENICAELKLTDSNFWVIMHRTKLNLRPAFKNTGTEMTEALRNIIYNCKQATFLIEKRISGKITTSETVKLHVHLAGCSVCKTFQQQSVLINRLFTGYQTDDLKLDEEFKAMLQARIEKEMHKN